MNVWNKKLLRKKLGQNIPAEEVLQTVNIVVYYFISKKEELDGRIYNVNKFEDVIEMAERKKIQILIIFINCGIGGVFEIEQDLSTDELNKNVHIFTPDDSETTDFLVYLYQIQTTPFMIVVSRDGDLISRNGFSDIEKIGTDVLVTWNNFFI